jgi:hypothetical protein
MLEHGEISKPSVGSRGAPTSKPKARARNRSATLTFRTPEGVAHCWELAITDLTSSAG